MLRRLEGERFNVITLKWWGRPRRVPSFPERHGLRGAFIAESPFLRASAETVGLEPIQADETDDPVGDLRKRVALVEQRLFDGDTSCSVTRRRQMPRGTPRIRASNSGDRRTHAAVERLPQIGQSSASPATTQPRASPDVIHSGDPVPFLLAGPGCAPIERKPRRARLRRRDSRPASRPRHDPVLLNAADGRSFSARGRAVRLSRRLSLLLEPLL